MDLPPIELAQRLLLAAGMALFLGIAFEETYKRANPLTPGGIRTFPTLALSGALLYLLDPRHAIAFVAGLLAVAVWIHGFQRIGREPRPVNGLIIPAANLLAYTLGPTALAQPPWVTIGVTVAGALLVGGRAQMHRLARAVPMEEVFTAAKFLVLVGLILPLLPNEPLTHWSSLTPYRVWLAVVAVSGISYASYLLQRFWPGVGRGLISAILGGLYSSTVTTVVLARRQREAGRPHPELSAGIIAATAVMYLRIGIITALFNLTLAAHIAPVLAVLVAAAAALAYWQWRRSGATTTAEGLYLPTSNPLQLLAAASFAVLFIVVSVGSTFVEQRYGARGAYGLALIVGFADVDSFTLSLAQGSLPDLSPAGQAAALLLAAVANNVAKAGYALFFGGWRLARGPAAALVALAALNLAGAGLLAG